MTVRVLQNDSDPEGGQLTVAQAEPTAEDVTAKVLAEAADPCHAPEVGEARRLRGALHRRERAAGGRARRFLTVTVDPDAQPLRPEVDDTDPRPAGHPAAAERDRRRARQRLLRRGHRGRPAGRGRRPATATRATRHRRRPHHGPVDRRVAGDPVLGRTARPPGHRLLRLHQRARASTTPCRRSTAAPAPVTVKSEATVRIPLQDYVVDGERPDREDHRPRHGQGHPRERRTTWWWTRRRCSSRRRSSTTATASISFEVTDGSVGERRQGPRRDARAADHGDAPVEPAAGVHRLRRSRCSRASRARST